MAGEQILIVDDTPVNLKLTRILLVNEGYKVLTAATAEEALDMLRNYHPQLLLADVQLPGMDGLELTRRVKSDPATQDISVVALTAFAMKGDEQKALEAGCDGYITKPIDTRALGARIRDFLSRRADSVGAPPAAPKPSDGALLPAAELQTLRKRFLHEGRETVAAWMRDLDTSFSANDAAAAVHQWIGTAGLLGYPKISQLAREADTILRQRPLDEDQLATSMRSLFRELTDSREVPEEPVPEPIIEALSGKYIGLVGLPPKEEKSLSTAMERARAVPVCFEASEEPDTGALKDCEIVVIHVAQETTHSKWLDPVVRPTGSHPVVLAGGRDDLLALDPQVQSLATEFLIDPWEPEEALVRLRLVLTERKSPAPKFSAKTTAPVGRAKVLIADDDPTVLALVRAALQNFGMECQTAADGKGAIDAIRRMQPHAAVLDVNMPGMDGFQVLAAVRSEEMPVRVILLTARQQESDVIRGFTLGADDYVVKPFSPMELVARLKRLLQR